MVFITIRDNVNILMRRFLTIIISSAMCLGTVVPALCQKQNRRIDNSVEKTFRTKQAMIERKQRQRINSKVVPKAEPVVAIPVRMALQTTVNPPRVTPIQTYTQPPKTVVPVKNISPKKQPLAPSNQSMFYTETQTLPDGRKISFLKPIGYQEPTVDRSKTGNQMIFELIRSSKPAPNCIDLTE